MTEEDKKLLLKDLCARLPYGVKGLHRGQVHSIKIMDASGLYPSLQVDCYDAWFPIETFKPYLRPMSSMTEEEKIIYQSKQTIIFDFKNNKLYVDNYYSLDYLNSIHVDYRGLIPKNLALEAPKDMYNLKEK